MKISNEALKKILEYISTEIQNIDYGELTIPLNENTGRIDIITTQRYRFSDIAESKKNKSNGFEIHKKNMSVI